LSRNIFATAAAFASESSYLSCSNEAQIESLPFTVFMCLSPAPLMNDNERTRWAIKTGLFWELLTVTLRWLVVERLVICQKQWHCRLLANVNSRSRSLYAIAVPSVCLSSVC